VKGSTARLFCAFLRNAAEFLRLRPIWIAREALVIDSVNIASAVYLMEAQAEAQASKAHQSAAAAKETERQSLDKIHHQQSARKPAQQPQQDSVELSAQAKATDSQQQGPDRDGIATNSRRIQIES
jgi:hypothetical protein